MLHLLNINNFYEVEYVSQRWNYNQDDLQDDGMPRKNYSDDVAQGKYMFECLQINFTFFFPPLSSSYLKR